MTTDIKVFGMLTMQSKIRFFLFQNFISDFIIYKWCLGLVQYFNSSYLTILPMLIVFLCFISWVYSTWYREYEPNTIPPKFSCFTTYPLWSLYETVTKPFRIRFYFCPYRTVWKTSQFEILSISVSKSFNYD